MRFRARVVLRLDRYKINIKVVGQSESLTEDAVLAVNLDTRKVVGIGTEALAWQGMASFQLVWPFAHPRLLLGDWDAARYLFQVLLKRATSARPLFKPEVLLQVIAPLEGGLSMIERRALLDAVRAGGLADTVVVCEGETVLSVEMVDELIRSGQTDAVAALPYLP